MPDSVRAENAVLLSKVVKKTYRYYRAIVNDLRTLYIFLFKQSCLLSVSLTGHFGSIWLIWLDLAVAASLESAAAAPFPPWNVRMKILKRRWRRM